MLPDPPDDRAMFGQIQVQHDMEVRRASKLEFKKPDSFDARKSPMQFTLEGEEVFFRDPAGHGEIRRVSDRDHRAEIEITILDHMQETITSLVRKLSYDPPFPSNSPRLSGDNSRGQALLNFPVPAILPDP